MLDENYIIYCDESAEKGRYYSHFYGGALISANYRENVSLSLAKKKAELNLFGELKWTKITENYAEKYIDFLDTYFDFIDKKVIRIRIMFSQNIYTATGLDDYQIDNQYFLLYYQFIKHAFGFEHSFTDTGSKCRIAIYLDDIPHTKEKFSEFKDYLISLNAFPKFKRNNVFISEHDITSINSHDHDILQGLDIILGAIQFRLNDLHLAKPKGSRFRGKRTRAKEKVYKHISKRIRNIYPNFNIGMTTGAHNGTSDRWSHAYRHWNFVPSDHKLDLTRAKKR